MATLAGNTPTTGTRAWTLVAGVGTITTATGPTSGLTIGATTFRGTISNAPCAASTDDVMITTTSSCGPASGVCTANWFTDARDGKQYGTVTIGSQIWMCENLAYLPSVVDRSPDSETLRLLYNWTAAMNRAVSSLPCKAGIYLLMQNGVHCKIHWKRGQVQVVIHLVTEALIQEVTSKEQELRTGTHPMSEPLTQVVSLALRVATAVRAGAA